MSDTFPTITDFCPLCGRDIPESDLPNQHEDEVAENTPAEEGAITGVNCAICQNCSLNLHIYTPRVCMVLCDAHVFTLISYVPTADEWDSDLPALLFSNHEYYYLPHQYPIAVAYETLTDAEQQLLKNVFTGPLGDTPTLAHVQQGRIDTDYYETLACHPSDSLPLSEKATKQLLRELPRPTVIQSRTEIYTSSVEEFVDVCSTTSSNTSQSGLTDF